MEKENLVSKKIVKSIDKIPFIRNHLDHDMLEVVNASAVALSMKVLGAGLAFAFNVMLARMMGIDGEGIFYLALIVVTIATRFERMGLKNVMLKLTAANASTS